MTMPKELIEGKVKGSHLRLSEIEKLDARFPGFAAAIKMCFDGGLTSPDIPPLMQARYGVTITTGMVEHFRVTKWIPERELKKLQKSALAAALEAFGGDAGMDAAVLAKLWELMDKMTIPQLMSARTLFLKVREQNLKEQEFLFKTGQLRPGQGEQADPQEQQRAVLHRIKEIFGLAADQEPAALAPALPAGEAAAPTAAPDDAPASEEAPET